MNKIDLQDIKFTEYVLQNGNTQIVGSVLVQASAILNIEVGPLEAVRLQAKKNLIDLLLRAIYGDVWDLAHYAEILIKNDARLQRDHPGLELLAMLGRIGKADDDINAALEGYRNPDFSRDR